MKILLTGANGQIGTEIQLLLEGNQIFELTALGRDQLDIGNPDQVNQAITSHSPDIVINAAAYTAVDTAESEPEQAFAVNATGPRLLAEACHLAGCILVHISTDFVFDGKQPDSYVETDPVNPLNVYGKVRLRRSRGARTLPQAHYSANRLGV